MKWISFLLLLSLAAGVQAQKSTRVDTQELLKLLKDPELQLVDVRYARELAGGGIAGAKHINLYDRDFEAKAQQLDKTKPVAVYCASGIRSARAAAKLEKLGFVKIYDLKGGFKGWKAEGLEAAPIEP